MLRKALLKLFNITTLLLWIVMMFLLVDREIYPMTSGQNIASYRYFLPKELLLRDHWMGIYFNDKKVGYSNTAVSAYEEKGFSGYEIRNETEMFVFLLGEYQKVFFNGSAMVDTNYNLKNFKFNLNTGSQRISVVGKLLRKNVIDLRIASGADVIKKEIQVPDDIFIANLLTPLEFLGKLASGKTFTLNVLEPFTLTVEKVKIYIKEKVDFESQNKLIRAYVVETEYKGLKLKSWVSEEGEILKEETSLGWIMVKEPMEKAIVYQRYMFEKPQDVALIISILPEGKTDLREGVSSMRVELEGLEAEEFELTDERQSVVSKTPLALEIKTKRISKEDSLKLPIEDKAKGEFTAPSRFIQSDSEEIMQLADKIAGEEKNSLVVAQKIKEWIFKNIGKRPIISIPDALGTLKRREGDCNEHSFLYAALARAKGIPTKVCYGLVYIEGRFYYHAWCKVFVGEWISIDPTLGEDFADATHIALLSGGLDKQLELVRLLGKLKIKILEHR